MHATYRQMYRFGELPTWVVMVNEGAAAYIDTLLGRFWLRSGDLILYDADWRPLFVERGWS